MATIQKILLFDIQLNANHLFDDDGRGDSPRFLTADFLSCSLHKTLKT